MLENIIKPRKNSRADCWLYLGLMHLVPIEFFSWKKIIVRQLGSCTANELIHKNRVRELSDRAGKVPTISTPTHGQKRGTLDADGLFSPGMPRNSTAPSYVSFLLCRYSRLSEAGLSSFALRSTKLSFRSMLWFLGKLKLEKKSEIFFLLCRLSS